MSKGFIAFKRDFFEESEYFSPKKFDEWHAYVDLIQKAQYVEKTTPDFLEGYELHMGQVSMSQVTLAERWKWDRKTVRNFLNKLKRKGLIDYKSYPRRNPITTITTISRYNEIISLGNKENCLSNKIPNNFPSEIPTLNNLITNTNKKEDINTIKDTIKDQILINNKESNKEMSLKGEIIEWILLNNVKDGIRIDKELVVTRVEDAISCLGFDKISEVFTSIKELRYQYISESFWRKVKNEFDKYRLSLLDHPSDNSD